MASLTAQPVPTMPESTAAATVWQKLVAWTVERRIRISLIVFLLLIAEDVIDGIKPHALSNIHDAKSMAGLGLILAGVGLRSWAAGTLHKLSRLTTTGPYSLIRNPLYVGSFLMMVGFCVIIDDPENIWFVLGPFLLLYVYKVRREERGLADQFGLEWDEYVKSTPRFFPLRIAGKLRTGWSLRQWLNNREYQAVGGAVVGLIAIAIWRLY